MILPKTDTSVFARLRFILVGTSHPGNIGAAARAIKTMGFGQLVLVEPRFDDALTHPEAIAFASGAQDILQQAHIVGSFAEAVKNCSFAAAVTARLREYSPPVLSPRAMAAEFCRLTQGAGEGATAGVDPGAGAGGSDFALVFGNERYGLPNDIVEKCNALISIPANPDYSSLNLAQAVQVLAYECRVAALGDAMVQDFGFQGQRASVEQIDAMFDHLQQALVEVGFLDADNPKKLMPRLKRLFGRTALETEEVNILRGIARQILQPRQRFRR
jgi:tRNA/rRNA methyltransferase